MRPEVQQRLPLKPADFHILLVLLEGKLHGCGIMKAVADETDSAVALEIGSLYRLLGRMLDEGLVQQDEPDEPGDRRRYYRITDLGREVAAAEARRLQGVLRTARGKRLLEA